MRSKYSVLRVISSFLVYTFLFEQLAFANPELLTPKKIDPFEKPKIDLKLPPSVAAIEDAFLADSVERVADAKDKNNNSYPLSAKRSTLIYLIQDAHTNPSGQFNLSKTIDALLDKDKQLKYVFVEAGVGDNSLSSYRKYGTAEQRRKIAEPFLRDGMLHGEEYLDLTSNKNFTIYGVENLELYKKALADYQYVAKEREKFESYRQRIQITVDTLKPRIYNSSLLEFDQKQALYRKERLPLTDYFEILKAEAATSGISLELYPHLATLKKLKEKENAIDFKKANEEQLEAIQSLNAKDQTELLEASKDNSPLRLKGEEQENKAFYALLEEKLLASSVERIAATKDKNNIAYSLNAIRSTLKYPELSKYFDYLKYSKQINPKEILIELKALEGALYQALSTTPDEKTLIKSQETIYLLEKLFKLTMTPEEYSAYKASREFSITNLTGFLNKKIIDLQTYYERVTFLEPGYEDMIRRAEDFYELTYQRDQHFIAAMLEKNFQSAVLITGGFHTPNLKSLLKNKNISFVSITPQVLQETNIPRYEKLLLNQKFSNFSAQTSVPLSGHTLRIGSMSTPALNQISHLPIIPIRTMRQKPSAAARLSTTAWEPEQPATLAGRWMLHESRAAMLTKKILPELFPAISAGVAKSGFKTAGADESYGFITGYNLRFGENPKEFPGMSADTLLTPSFLTAYSQGISFRRELLVRLDAQVTASFNSLLDKKLSERLQAEGLARPKNKDIKKNAYLAGIFNAYGDGAAHRAQMEDEVPGYYEEYLRGERTVNELVAEASREIKEQFTPTLNGFVPFSNGEYAAIFKVDALGRLTTDFVKAAARLTYPIRELPDQLAQKLLEDLRSIAGKSSIPAAMDLNWDISAQEAEALNAAPVNMADPMMHVTEVSIFPSGEEFNYAYRTEHVGGANSFANLFAPRVQILAPRELWDFWGEIPGENFQIDMKPTTLTAENEADLLYFLKNFAVIFYLTDKAWARSGKKCPVISLGNLRIRPNFVDYYGSLGVVGITVGLEGDMKDIPPHERNLFTREDIEQMKVDFPFEQMRDVLERRFLESVRFYLEALTKEEPLGSNYESIKQFYYKFLVLREAWERTNEEAAQIGISESLRKIFMVLEHYVPLDIFKPAHEASLPVWRDLESRYVANRFSDRDTQGNELTAVPGLFAPFEIEIGKLYKSGEAKGLLAKARQLAYLTAADLKRLAQYQPVADDIYGGDVMKLLDELIQNAQARPSHGEDGTMLAAARLSSRIITIINSEGEYLVPADWKSKKIQTLSPVKPGKSAGFRINRALLTQELELWKDAGVLPDDFTVTEEVETGTVPPGIAFMTFSSQGRKVENVSTNTADIASAINRLVFIPEAVQILTERVTIQTEDRDTGVAIQALQDEGVGNPFAREALMNVLEAHMSNDDSLPGTRVSLIMAISRAFLKADAANLQAGERERFNGLLKRLSGEMSGVVTRAVWTTAQRLREKDLEGIAAARLTYEIASFHLDPDYPALVRFINDWAEVVAMRSEINNIRFVGFAAQTAPNKKFIYRYDGEKGLVRGSESDVLGLGLNQLMDFLFPAHRGNVARQMVDAGQIVVLGAGSIKKMGQMIKKPERDLSKSYFVGTVNAPGKSGVIIFPYPYYQDAMARKEAREIVNQLATELFDASHGARLSKAVMQPVATKGVLANPATTELFTHQPLILEVGQSDGQTTLLSVTIQKSNQASSKAKVFPDFKHSFVVATSLVSASTQKEADSKLRGVAHRIGKRLGFFDIKNRVERSEGSTQLSQEIKQLTSYQLMLCQKEFGSIQLLRKIMPAQYQYEWVLNYEDFYEDPNKSSVKIGWAGTILKIELNPFEVNVVTSLIDRAEKFTELAGHDIGNKFVEALTNFPMDWSSLGEGITDHTGRLFVTILEEGLAQITIYAGDMDFPVLDTVTLVPRELNAKQIYDQFIASAQDFFRQKLEFQPQAARLTVLGSWSAADAIGLLWSKQIDGRTINLRVPSSARGVVFLDVYDGDVFLGSYRFGTEDDSRQIKDGRWDQLPIEDPHGLKPKLDTVFNLFHGDFSSALNEHFNVQRITPSIGPVQTFVGLANTASAPVQKVEALIANDGEKRINITIKDGMLRLSDEGRVLHWFPASEERGKKRGYYSYFGYDQIVSGMYSSPDGHQLYFVIPPKVREHNAEIIKKIRARRGVETWQIPAELPRDIFVLREELPPNAIPYNPQPKNPAGTLELSGAPKRKLLAPTSTAVAARLATTLDFVVASPRNKLRSQKKAALEWSELPIQNNVALDRELKRLLRDKIREYDSSITKIGIVGFRSKESSEKWTDVFVSIQLNSGITYVLDAINVSFFEPSTAALAFQGYYTAIEENHDSSKIIRFRRPRLEVLSADHNYRLTIRDDEPVIPDELLAARLAAALSSTVNDNNEHFPVLDGGENDSVKFRALSAIGNNNPTKDDIDRLIMRLNHSNHSDMLHSFIAETILKALKNNPKLKLFKRDLQNLLESVAYRKKSVRGVIHQIIRLAKERDPQLKSFGPGARLSADEFDRQVKVAEKFLKKNRVEARWLTVERAEKRLWLNLSDTTVSSIAPLARLTSLHSLDLSRTRVVNIRPLAKLGNLTKLYLSHTRIKDFAVLSKLEKLEILKLANTVFSDKDLARLKELTNLRELDVRKTLVTGKQVGEFVTDRASPGLTVITQGARLTTEIREIVAEYEALRSAMKGIAPSVSARIQGTKFPKWIQDIRDRLNGITFGTLRNFREEPSRWNGDLQQHLADINDEMRQLGVAYSEEFKGNGAPQLPRFLSTDSQPYRAARLHIERLLTLLQAFPSDEATSVTPKQPTGLTREELNDFLRTKLLSPLTASLEPISGDLLATVEVKGSDVHIHYFEVTSNTPKLRLAHATSPKQLGGVREGSLEEFIKNGYYFVARDANKILHQGNPRTISLIAAARLAVKEYQEHSYGSETVIRFKGIYKPVVLISRILAQQVITRIPDLRRAQPIPLIVDEYFEGHEPGPQDIDLRNSFSSEDVSRTVSNLLFGKNVEPSQWDMLYSTDEQLRDYISTYADAVLDRLSEMPGDEINFETLKENVEKQLIALDRQNSGGIYQPAHLDALVSRTLNVLGTMVEMEVVDFEGARLAAPEWKSLTMENVAKLKPGTWIRGLGYPTTYILQESPIPTGHGDFTLKVEHLFLGSQAERFAAPLIEAGYEFVERPTDGQIDAVLSSHGLNPFPEGERVSGGALLARLDWDANGKASLSYFKVSEKSHGKKLMAAEYYFSKFMALERLVGRHKKITELDADSPSPSNSITKAPETLTLPNGKSIEIDEISGQLVATAHNGGELHILDSATALTNYLLSISEINLLGWTPYAHGEETWVYPDPQKGFKTIIQLDTRTNRFSYTNQFDEKQEGRTLKELLTDLIAISAKVKREEGGAAARLANLKEYFTPTELSDLRAAVIKIVASVPADDLNKAFAVTSREGQTSSLRIEKSEGKVELKLQSTDEALITIEGFAAERDALKAGKDSALEPMNGQELLALLKADSISAELSLTPPTASAVPIAIDLSLRLLKKIHNKEEYEQALTLALLGVKTAQDQYQKQGRVVEFYLSGEHRLGEDKEWKMQITRRLLEKFGIKNLTLGSADAFSQKGIVVTITDPAMPSNYQANRIYISTQQPENGTQLSWGQIFMFGTNAAAAISTKTKRISSEYKIQWDVIEQTDIPLKIVDYFNARLKEPSEKATAAILLDLLRGNPQALQKYIFLPRILKVPISAKIQAARMARQMLSRAA